MTNERKAELWDLLTLLTKSVKLGDFDLYLEIIKNILGGAYDDKNEKE